MLPIVRMIVVRIGILFILVLILYIFVMCYIEVYIHVFTLLTLINRLRV